MSSEVDRDDARALDTITAAVEAGITLFDTAHAYGLDESEYGHNERLLTCALRACGAEGGARIITKGGMSRPGGGWVPDGRASTIRRDCEASLVALDGLPIELFLIHAPDPRTPWGTTVRALARLVDEGLVRHVGVSNVNLQQLGVALDLAPITAVQNALSVFDDTALRGGVLNRCAEANIAFIAHSPLGGPRRAGALARQATLGAIAARTGRTPAELALAWLHGLSPGVVAIPGARSADHVRSVAQAASIPLDDGDRKRLDDAFGRTRPSEQARRRSVDASTGEVVVVMGIPGAGKSRIAGDYVDRGYTRLNRDERGGGLRDLADALEEALATGSGHVVLDNTYLSRASRSHVIDVANQFHISARCVWLDTPLEQAQVNLVQRMLEHFGSLPDPGQLRASRTEPGVMPPTSQMRALRDLEQPTVDEGWQSVERVDFTRETKDGIAGGGVFVAASVLSSPGWQGAIGEADPAAPHLVFDWRPEEQPQDMSELATLLALAITGPVEHAICPHGGGPPQCWCRPPLPGLPLAFAHRHGLDPGRSVLVGATPTHQRLAAGLGARFVTTAESAPRARHRPT